MLNHIQAVHDVREGVLEPFWWGLWERMCNCEVWRQNYGN